MLNKSVLLLTALLLSLSVFAASPKVILEVSTGVGFAPPEYRGVYRTQVLDSGAVIYIDNHQVVTPILKLSNQALLKLKNELSLLKVQKPLIGDENSPGCMDAPTTTTKIPMANGKSIVLKSWVNCKTTRMEGADLVIEIADNLEELAHRLK